MRGGWVTSEGWRTQGHLDSRRNSPEVSRSDLPRVTELVSDRDNSGRDGMLLSLEFYLFFFLITLDSPHLSSHFKVQSGFKSPVLTTQRGRRRRRKVGRGGRGGDSASA